MSLAHLKDLRKCLDGVGWGFVSEEEGDDRAISAVWVYFDPRCGQKRHIEFEGLDADGQLLPVERAYACHVREMPELSLYFHRAERGWSEALAQFAAALDRSHGA